MSIYCIICTQIICLFCIYPYCKLMNFVCYIVNKWNLNYVYFYAEENKFKSTQIRLAQIPK